MTSPDSEPRIRVLVTFEREYHAYGDAIASTIQALRPRAEVTVVEPQALEIETIRLSPHVVISSRPEAEASGHTLAWIELPHDPHHAGKIHFKGKSSESYDLALPDLLSVVDRAQDIIG